MSEGVRTDLVLATSSDVLRKVFGYVVLAALARSLSKNDMGELFFATAFASVFAMLTELGTHRYLTRAVAQDRGQALDRLSEVLSLRLPVTLGAFLLLNAIGWLFMRERVYILLPTSVFVLVGDIYYSFGALFLGLRRLGYRFLTGLIDVVLLMVLVLVAVRLDWDLPAVLICYVASKVALVVTTAAVVRWSFGPYGLVSDPARLRKVAAESFPFFVLVFLGLTYLKVDTLMILFISSAEEVARYEAGYKFFEISRFVVRATGMVFFPLCAALVVRRDWRGVRSLSGRLLIGAAGTGMALAAGVIGLAPTLVPLVWGDEYDTSIPILRVLFFGLPFLYISFVSTFVAQAMRLERSVVHVMLVAVAANIAMNAVAIPRWGSLGAAWTTVIGESFLSAALVSIVLRGVSRMRSDDLAMDGAT